ncbi:hypothetical protein B0T22DRAFT_94390 [Podospora appendiculata]|uniref:Uncharacterized protein n=1 Tax=Podospora appendiculata TaxID=314037 RepID=A0AAE1CHR9_9PEZI|nr:hypothetical protein B0T22DRAFT_94390 [Podospora appendiculata]
MQTRQAHCWLLAYYTTWHTSLLGLARQNQELSKSATVVQHTIKTIVQSNCLNPISNLAFSWHLFDAIIGFASSAHCAPCRGLSCSSIRPGNQAPTAATAPNRRTCRSSIQNTPIVNRRPGCWKSRQGISTGRQGISRSNLDD